MFTKEDLLQLEKKGISQEQAMLQIKNFREGFPYIRLAAPATVGAGILRVEGAELEDYVSHFEKESGGRGILKFVPASGAATRMFKDLFSWREKLRKGVSPDELFNQEKEAKQFFTQMKTFAFWDDLSALLADRSLNADELLEKQQYLTLLDTLLDEDGLGYAMLPKGLLKFHRYGDSVRTPVEEHIVEGAHYACDSEGTVKIHFTVSSEHRGRFVNHIGDVLKSYEDEFGLRFEMKFSVQKPSTDIIAVDMNNEPFRESDGTLLFRPGGHGALIQNLNEIKEDVVFIKNIDNVVPDSLKDHTYLYKRALGGMLIMLQDKIHDSLRAIDEGTFTDEQYHEMRKFASGKLFIDEALLPEDPAEGIGKMKELFNRPMRICGMVKNVGEPGGGPFWVENPEDHSRSLQIVESSQVNHDDPRQQEIFEQATHFNPVDLVCGLKDYRGEAFDLTKYVDPQTGFISKKSKDGKDLKAQELPGLWNGAMANWTTIFVEVPLITFNPVKTITDLLRKEHL
ncbi:MAG: DUF4301 family protein [Bacteroidota bacterium]